MRKFTFLMLKIRIKQSFKKIRILKQYKFNDLMFFGILFFVHRQDFPREKILSNKIHKKLIIQFFKKSKM